MRWINKKGLQCPDAVVLAVWHMEEVAVRLTDEHHSLLLLTPFVLGILGDLQPGLLLLVWQFWLHHGPVGYEVQMDLNFSENGYFGHLAVL